VYADLKTLYLSPSLLSNKLIHPPAVVYRGQPAEEEDEEGYR
jgi:hypothetical protein